MTQPMEWTRRQTVQGVRSTKKRPRALQGMHEASCVEALAGHWCVEMGGAAWLHVAYREAGVCGRGGEAHGAGGQGTGDRAFLGSRRRCNLAFINMSPEDLAATRSIRCRWSGLEARG